MGRVAEGFKLRQDARTGLYTVRYTIEGKRYHRSTGVRSKRAAAKRAAELYAEDLANPQIPPPKGELAGLIARWLIFIGQDAPKPKSPEWVARLKRYATKYWLTRWTDLDQITADAGLAYVKERRAEGNADVTIHKEISGLRQFLKWCAKQPDLAGYAVPAIESVTPDVADESLCLSKGEVLALLDKLEGTAADYYRVMWATAFRPGTMARLKWPDVDLRRLQIAISAKQDKGRYRRAVPILKPTATILSRMKKHAQGELVFGDERYRDELKTAAKASGLDADTAAKVVPYTIRHSRITYWASNSKNIVAIMFLAGHKHIGTTMKYFHADTETARDLLKEVD